MLALGQRLGNTARLVEVVQVLIKHGFVSLVRRAQLHKGLPTTILEKLHIMEAPDGEPETQGNRLRAALMELGPTFVKFGQILSTRPELVGNAISEDLRKLQDKVTVTPFEQMETVLKAELSEEALAGFVEFQQEPVASASLSQVYRAKLKTGERVAVKIQRPGIEAVIESDLSLMELVAEWVADHVEEAAWMDPAGIVDEFAHSIRRELDFHIERRVMERFRKNLEGVDNVFVPVVYGDYSGKRVLTMDWIDGVRIDAMAQYPARNCDPVTVAMTGVEVLCRQVFEFRFFHADPHPGNIFITRNNRIAFLDYGMVGHLERTDTSNLADLLHAMFRENAGDCVNAMLMLTTTGEAEDRQSLEHQVADFIAFESQAVVSGGNVGQGIARMVDILHANKLQLASRFSLLLKALATIESVGHLLDPAMDMAHVLQPYVEKLVARRYSPLRLLEETQLGFEALFRLARHMPADIEELLMALRRGKLKFQVRHEHLEQLTTVLDRASNRIAFGVITGSLIIGSSFLTRTGSGFSWLGITGYLIAGVLGLYLMISVVRSKNY